MDWASPAHQPSKIVLYDPAVSSLNLGDHIISDSARRHLDPLLSQAYVVEVSTHLPASPYLRLVKDADARFVLGSNLLRGRMNGLFRQWDIHLGYAHWLKPAILMGVGWWQYGDEPNRYTKLLYRQVLSSQHVHSARDSYTADRLSAMGHKVLMTGCPTMWNLTPDHCAGIPTTQSSAVVTTLTDYAKDPVADRRLLEVLLRNYERVHFWIQGYHDLEYLRTFGSLVEGVELVKPNLAAFDAVLDDPNVEFVGTRLHAGIRALQKRRRTLILGVDNRAREKSRDFALPVVPRADSVAIESWVKGSSETRISLPLDAIKEWKSQFGLMA